MVAARYLEGVFAPEAHKIDHTTVEHAQPPSIDPTLVVHTDKVNQVRI